MIYIMSDIHGLYDRYRKMMEKIALKPEDRLYILGDVIDRGPDSFPILFDIMERENVEMFLGNHEHMMLTWMDGTDRESWFYPANGGKITCRKFFDLDTETQEEVLNYLIYHTTVVKHLDIAGVHYVLSHSCAPSSPEDLYTADYADDLMAIQNLLWNMGKDNTYDLGKREDTGQKITFISGHIITRHFEPDCRIHTESHPNGCTWIDIDCGCAMGKDAGYLCCLQISEEGKITGVHYVQ